MKIIDILVNIANHKEVPEQIKYRDIIYIYDYKNKDYYEKGFNGRVTHSLFGYLFSNTATDDFINDEVEIIEENKDIEELEIIENIGNYYIVKDGKQCQLNRHDTVIIDKINELVREVNKIRRELKNND